MAVRLGPVFLTDDRVIVVEAVFVLLQGFNHLHDLPAFLIQEQHLGGIVAPGVAGNAQLLAHGHARDIAHRELLALE